MYYKILCLFIVTFNDFVSSVFRRHHKLVQYDKRRRRRKKPTHVVVQSRLDSSLGWTISFKLSYLAKCTTVSLSCT